MRQLAAEGIFDIDQRGASRDAERLAAEPAGRLGPETRGQRLGRTPRGKARAVEPGNRTIDAVEQRGESAVTLGRDNFARRDSRDLLAHSGYPGNPGREKLPGRDVDRRKSKPGLTAVPRTKREQKTLLARCQHGLLAHRARRDYAHD